MNKKTKPIVLTVLDGWGYRAETNGNAIALARKPAYDQIHGLTNKFSYLDLRRFSSTEMKAFFLTHRQPNGLSSSKGGKVGKDFGSTI